jgi:predicted dehydrogenase
MNKQLAATALAIGLMNTIGLAQGDSGTVRLITLDPGHFHAALVQKFMYPQVDPVVNVYSPGGADLDQHLARIESYNKRAENPTKWQEKVLVSPDFLKVMLQEKPGNVVVLSGNNRFKTDYIHKSIDAGLNVLADKPMAVNSGDFGLLRKTFALAQKRNVLLYDIMTERYEITSILQRELAQFPEVFGTLETGTADDPAVVIESIHHFFKEVSGKPLIRPAWFFDVRQQGEALPDVGTHLVDLVQWICFPDVTLDWKKDVNVYAARHWPTRLTPEQFQKATGLSDYPKFLRKDVDANGMLNVLQNGEVCYTLRGVHVKVRPLWKFEAPEGTKDSHYARLRGTKANLEIRQGPAQDYKPTLYVEARYGTRQEDLEAALKAAVQQLQARHPGIEAKSVGQLFQIVIPEKYAVGHEAHFGAVTEAFLKYLAEGKLPSWEVPNMLAKYYTTIEAYELSRRNPATEF